MVGGFVGCWQLAWAMTTYRRKKLWNVERRTRREVCRSINQSIRWKWKDDDGRQSRIRISLDGVRIDVLL